MRITIDIDDKNLREVQKATGCRKKSPAINKAIDDYLRRFRLMELFHQLERGTIDYSTTNDELEAMWSDVRH